MTCNKIGNIGQHFKKQVEECLKICISDMRKGMSECVSAYFMMINSFENHQPNVVVLRPDHALETPGRPTGLECQHHLRISDSVALTRAYKFACLTSLYVIVKLQLPTVLESHGSNPWTNYAHLISQDAEIQRKKGTHAGSAANRTKSSNSDPVCNATFRL